MAQKKSSPPASAPAGLTFEKSLAELEKIITRLEGEECPLECAVENFEKGVGLLRVCQEHLARAQGKITRLMQSEEGKFIEKELGLTADFVSDRNTADE